MALSDLRALRSRVVAGAVAGPIACGGIKKNDVVLVVQDVLAASPNLALTEFKALADDFINNTTKNDGSAGTNTTGKMMLVLWIVKNPRA